jgi:L-ascorbate metabolism protein UlaG (beta-lactamase superfamily)
MSRLQLGELGLTYIGGPTALLEIAGLRLLTDPTFDAPGEEPGANGVVYRKLTGPAVTPESLGRVDAVLLSHDHHLDNLDHVGRAFLRNAGQVITTVEGAGRLGNFTSALAPWRHTYVPTADGRALRVTATPARHGPANGDRGPVIGFALSLADPTIDDREAIVPPADPADRPHAIYVSGDTVWFDGVADIGQRFIVDTALLFMGAARVAAAGPHHLTLTADEGVEFARAFPEATIVPLHYEGWAHFSESRDVIAKAFADAGLTDRLRWADQAD